MEELRGEVQRIIFENEKSPYAVFSLWTLDQSQETCAGNIVAPMPGMQVVVRGTYKVHKTYGRQFAVSSVEVLRPETEWEAEQFLDAMNIPGLGAKSRERIIDYFGPRLVEVLNDEDPKELLEVPGLRKTVAKALYDSLRGEGYLSEISRFLEEHKLGTRWAKDLYDFYGPHAIDAIMEKPYLLIHLPNPMDFKTVDKFALAIGVAEDSPVRIREGLHYILDGLGNQGHSCQPADELIAAVDSLLGGQAEAIALEIEEELLYGDIASVTHEDLLYVYPVSLYEAEKEGAERSLSLVGPMACQSSVDLLLESYEKEEGVILGDKQKEAIAKAMDEQVLVITGGPGTGKTTIVKALVTLFTKSGYHFIGLCAPTGRAAKRLTEATGFEAVTIHRMLQPEEGDDYAFTKNADDPLDYEVLIIDEASMLNIELYSAVLAAIKDTTRLVIVGDVDQLPPIGAGFVLRDLLDSGVVPYVRLETIYRQEAGNQIIDNAYAIKKGEMPVSGGEFKIVPCDSVTDMMDKLCSLYFESLKGVQSSLDVQIVSPMRRGPAGCVAISTEIQNYFTEHGRPEIGEEVGLERVVDEESRGKSLFPDSRKKSKAKRKPFLSNRGRKFFFGDKIIQTVNNYDIELFNGEIGLVIDGNAEGLDVRFPDKELSMGLDDIESMMLAHAVTVHKAQGSEYDTVFIPFLPTHGLMLQRNLLYTAVTRAKKEVVIVGTEGAIRKALATVSQDRRITLFKERLQGLIEGEQ